MRKRSSIDDLLAFEWRRLLQSFGNHVFAFVEMCFPTNVGVQYL